MVDNRGTPRVLVTAGAVLLPEGGLAHTDILIEDGRITEVIADGRRPRPERPQRLDRAGEGRRPGSA